MQIGTKSLLFGVHQFVWHPVTVWLAWRKLYGRFPGFREMVCIIIHDWGYWGSPDLDGAEGACHPVLGARIAGALFGSFYRDLCLFHSRSYARRHNREPSKLCWADKLSLSYDPWWFYLFRAGESGELAEYRKLAPSAGGPDESTAAKEWFLWLRRLLAKEAFRSAGARSNFTASLPRRTINVKIITMGAKRR